MDTDIAGCLCVWLHTFNVNTLGRRRATPKNNKKMSKLIIKKDVLLRKLIIQARRHLTVFEMKDD
jgi:hypothetical protein